MTYTIVHGTVPDYPKWRLGFDDFEGLRRQFGATGKNQIYRDKDDPNTLTLILEWSDEKRAREWFESPRLRQAMKDDGFVLLSEPHVTTAA